MVDEYDKIFEERLADFLATPEGRERLAGHPITPLSTKEWWYGICQKLKNVEVPKEWL